MTVAMRSLENRTILLVIGGGIAAYKVLDLVRRLRERGATVRAVLSRSARHFVTPLAVSALTGERAFGDLFDVDEEGQIGHIRLARETDLVVVAPATADLLARMAHGLADDLATAVLLATDKPVLVAPAMNPRMWAHPATRRNVEQLRADGIEFIGPEAGEMAEEAEAGIGRLAEPLAIAAAIEVQILAGPPEIAAPSPRRLAGLSALVTSGPTHEPIDPVRYLANRSSGRQGHAIAAALRRHGAEVTLVSGPVDIAAPAGVETIAVQTAREMKDAVEAALPVDIAVMAAAVADWRVEQDSAEKIKKGDSGPPTLKLVENPDILAGLTRHGRRPRLVVGFAAETENLLANAAAKLGRKGADWIVANDVSPESGVMGGEHNRVHLITPSGVENWPDMTKVEVAERLAERIADWFATEEFDFDVPAAPAPATRDGALLAAGPGALTGGSVHPTPVRPAALPAAPAPSFPANPVQPERTEPEPAPFIGGSLDIRPER
jgi:phosphopantothenoylcysteine decarboxylase/phosphopantothenate--cysteine ligase